MINIEDFTKRLELILDYYSLNASSFADKIGAQRSSLSHLLSGRNKPSLDFILKILDVFPEVDLYWILNGKGTFPKSESLTEQIIGTTTPITNNQFIETTTDKKIISLTDDLTNPKNLSDEKSLTNMTNINNSIFEKKNSEIEQIVIFYKNGTFKTFSPE